jgi:hypothetical protein
MLLSIAAPPLQLKSTDFNWEETSIGDVLTEKNFTAQLLLSRQS